MAVVTMRQLLESGAHFGHQTKRWNPKMKRFIFTERNGIYIIDLTQTLGYIDRAYDFVKETVAHGGTIMFVGTKRQAQEQIAEHAKRVGMPYVTERWLGGMLTNFSTVYKRLQRLKELELIEETGGQTVLTKKEALVLDRERKKLRPHPGRHPRDDPHAQRDLDRRHEQGAPRGQRGAQARHPGRRDPRHQLRPRHRRLQDPGQRRRDPLDRRAHPRDRRRRRRGPAVPGRRERGRRQARGRRRGEPLPEWEEQLLTGTEAAAGEPAPTSPAATAGASATEGTAPTGEVLQAPVADATGTAATPQQ